MRTAISRMPSNGWKGILESTAYQTEIKQLFLHREVILVIGSKV